MRKNAAYRVYGIYSIVNTVTNQRYIGSSNDVKRRLKRHKTDLIKGKHRNSKLQQCFDSYGLDVFTFNIVEETKDLIEREQYHMDQERWVDLLNKSKYAKSHIANYTRKPVTVTNVLTQEVIVYPSIVEAALAIGMSRINRVCINAPTLLRKKYKVTDV